MSSIDERIVQMKFDNKDFESNAGTTMSTLEKLKEKLKFTKSDEGISNLKNSFNGFNFSGIETGVDSISDRFSALGIAGMEVIRRLTNAAIDMGERIAKSFTIDPIIDGFNEYELKMGSVQTILMGAHTDEGLPVTLDMVNEKLNELNTYADKTIYSFSDMTSNIGKFTNAGVSLDKSVAAIQGISNVAALSGANAQQASHAMYNFAQALSSGAVKLIDWKSIENANMATVEFKQTLIDTAENLGTLVKDGDQWISTTTDAQGKTSELFDATMGFNDSLRAQWMTTDVLTEALARYANEEDELGKKAFEAATQVKTWSQLKDTVKEALGSGWAQTWEYIIGDFEEAKQMWTGLNNIISGIIDPIADARNEMFKFWHDNGGRDAMLEAFNALWEKLSGVANIVKGRANAIFTWYFGDVDWGQALVNATKAVRDFFKNLNPSNELKSAFTRVIEAFFSAVGRLGETLARVGRFISAFWKAIEPGRKILYGIVENLTNIIAVIIGIGDLIAESFEANGGLQALANGFANLFNKIMELAGPAVEKVKDFFYELIGNPAIQKIGEVLAALAKRFEEFTESIDVQAISEKLSSFFEKFAGVLSTIWGFISPVVTGIWEFVSSLLGIGDSADTAGDKIDGAKEKVTSIKDALTELKDKVVQWFIDHAPADLVNDVSTAIEKLNGFLQPLKDRASAIKESFSDGTWYSKLKEWIGGVVDSIGDLKDTIADFVGDAAVQAFTAVWEFIAGAFNKFVDAVKAGWGFIKTVWKSLFGDDLYTAVNRIFEFLNKLAGVKALFTLTDILDNVSELAEGLSKLKTNLEKASINLTKSFLAPMKAFATKTKSEAIKNIAISIAILTASLIALSFVEFDKIQNGIIAVGELLAMIIGFYTALEFISKKMNNTTQRGGGILSAIFGNNAASSSLKSNSVGFVALAASVLILSLSLAKLAAIPFMDLQKGLLSIAELMVGLFIFSKYMKELKVGALDVTALSIAIDLLSVAVEKMGRLDFESWLKGIGGLALVMIELSAFMHDMENVSTKGFAGVIALAAGIRVLVMSVKALGGLDLPSLAKGLGGVAVLFVELYFFTKKMEDIDTKGFAGVIVLAVGLRLLVNSVAALGSLDFETLLKGLGGVAILLIELSAFMHDMSSTVSMSIGAAAAIIVLATALRILTTSVTALGGMSLGDMVQGLVGVAAALLAMSLAAKFLDGTSPLLLLTAAAMVVMSAAILLLVPAVKILGEMDFLSIVQGIGAIAAVFIIFGAAGAILGPMSLLMIGAAAAIAIMAAAVWIVVPPLVALGAMPLTNLGTALLALAGVFVIFGAAGLILGPLAPLMFAAAGGILALDVAAAGAGVAMIAIAAGMSGLGKAIPIFMDSILALLQSILGGLPFIGDDIDAWFTERREAIKGSMNPEEAQSDAESWTKGIADGISAGKSSVNEQTQGMKDTLKGMTDGGKEAGQGYSSNLLEGLDIGGLKGMLSGDMGDLTGELEGLLTQSGGNAGSGFNSELLESIGMDELSSTLTGDMGDLGIDMEDMMSEMGINSGDAYMSSFTKSVDDHAPGLYVTIGNKTEYVTEETLKKYQDMGLITGKEYTQAIADQTENGFGEVEVSTETAMDRIKGIATLNAGTSGEAAAQEFIASILNKHPELQNAAADTIGEFVDGLTNAEGDVENEGDSLMGKFADGILSSKGNVEDSTEEVVGSAENILYDSYDGGYSGGQNFGYGFGDGTSSTSSYVESAASSLARSALNAMKSELQEASPSKATRKFGKFGGMGLALGFKDTTSEVKNQAAALAGNGLTVMQDAMEKLRNLLNFDADFDPTIRPVLDLQQIQNGMSTLGSMLGGSQFALAGAFGIDPYAFAGIRSVTSASGATPAGDQSVVNAVNELKTEISTLKSAMEQMKFEADGKVIGEVAYREVDRRLGNTVARNRREGRG